ncbi:MAG: protein kinase, partial [Deltaproteobacteria bacterium]|nr:protein kinase [Deltaproteobacteria bacterium]
TDFGIAKAMTQTHETQTGVLKGKYAYMSPEQAVGRGLDHRSDLFSTGIMLWEMLFERRLFAGKNDLETLENVRTASVPWPEDGAARLFPGLREVLDRALQLSPESRFASAEEFAEALEACLPREKRVGRRELAKFLSEIFAEEIQHRRQLAQEIQHKTESFLRQTKVGPPEDEPTISLVESKTELEARPAAEPKPPPASAPARGAFPSWIWSFALLFLLLPTAYGIWKIPKAEKREAPTVTGQASVVATAPTIPVASPVPESRPTVSPPQASPVPLRGTLNLKVLPEGAQLKAVFPGGPRQGRGELNLEGLAPGTLVQVSASMANFETQTKSFTIRENPSAQNDVFKLEKKTPAFGEIRVNAVPWGRVSIPGLVVGGETPVTRSRIPEGRYPVSVTNPTLHQTLTATAVVRGGKTTQCHADFEGRGGISCR